MYILATYHRALARSNLSKCLELTTSISIALLQFFPRFLLLSTTHAENEYRTATNAARFRSKMRKRLHADLKLCAKKTFWAERANIGMNVKIGTYRRNKTTVRAKTGNSPKIIFTNTTNRSDI